MLFQWARVKVFFQYTLFFVMTSNFTYINIEMYLYEDVVYIEYY